MAPIPPQRLEDLRRRLHEKLEQRRMEREQPCPPLPGGEPEYDAVYFAGTAWLDAIAAGKDDDEALAIGDRVYADLTATPATRGGE